MYGLELGCSVRRTGVGHITRLPSQLVLVAVAVVFVYWDMYEEVYAKQVF